MDGVEHANAFDVGKRQWIVGHFIDRSIPTRHSEMVEIKWSKHPAGEEKNDFAKDTVRGITILIHGQITQYFRDSNGVVQQFELTEPGDFVASLPGHYHRWKVLQDDTLVVTVKWPSLAKQDATNN